MAQTCVLVVDDEPIGREMMAENLAIEGYRVIEAARNGLLTATVAASPCRA